ncbi:MAG: hypothetical protein IJ060_03225 [Oscillospiraceae bacterium]|nr:hypothetical protein [Oscillospiraceae bacterium]
MADEQTQNTTAWQPANRDRDLTIAKWLSLAAGILMLLPLLNTVYAFFDILFPSNSLVQYHFSFLGIVYELMLLWLAIYQFKVISGMKSGKKTDSAILVVLAGMVAYQFLNRGILSMVLHFSFFNLSGFLTLLEFGAAIAVLVLFWKNREDKLLPILVFGLAVYRLIVARLISAILYAGDYRGTNSSVKTKLFFQCLNPFHVEGYYLTTIKRILSIMSNVSSFLAFGLFWAAIFFVLRAKARAVVPESDGETKTAHKNTASVLLTLTALFACGVLGVNWLMSLGGSGGGGGGRVGGLCQWEGCNRPAVGPTYEFCEFHKKSLNDYWKYSNAYQ